MRKVVVVGPGAMGLLFAFRLADSGLDVTLLDYREDRAWRLNAEGIELIESGGLRRRRRVKCVADPEKCDPADFVFLWVKAYDTQRALQYCLPALAPHTVLVSLQNGFRHVELIRSRLPASRTVFGTTAQGATLIGVNCVRHCGSGDTVVACETENAPQAHSVVDLLCSAGIKSYHAQDLPFLLWRKLVFNAAINPVTSLLGVRNGEILKIPAAWWIAKRCFEEGRDVGRCIVGQRMGEVSEEQLAELCRVTAENQSSMLQDFRRSKPTEIDAINGVIVEEGERLGRPTPVNQTVLNLVKAFTKAKK